MDLKMNQVAGLGALFVSLWYAYIAYMTTEGVKSMPFNLPPLIFVIMGLVGAYGLYYSDQKKWMK